MKNFIVLCFFALVAVALGRPEEKYTNKYDNLNIQEILDNPRLLDPYMKCVVDEGKCTAAGNELKSHIQEALETYCAKCTDIQKAETRHVIGHLINEEPVYWEKMTAKFDPAKKYVTKYESELKKITA